MLTDYKPLLGAFQSNSDQHSPRETRHLDYQLQFTSDIRYIKGDISVPADALSRWINALMFEYQRFVDQLTSRMTNLAYNSPAKSQRPTYVPKLLQVCTHVFVWYLAKTNTLQPSCRRPFKVQKRHPKSFFLNYHGTLLLSGWNLLFWMLHASVTLPPPVALNVLKETVTRYGRHVRQSKHMLN